jgi:hypothetical protein
VGSPRCSKMARTPPGAVRYASTRRLLHTKGHANTSSAKGRRSSPAQSSRSVFPFFVSSLSAATGGGSPLPVPAPPSGVLLGTRAGGGGGPGGPCDRPWRVKEAPQGGLHVALQAHHYLARASGCRELLERVRPSAESFSCIRAHATVGLPRTSLEHRTPLVLSPSR